MIQMIYDIIIIICLIIIGLILLDKAQRWLNE